MLYLAMHRTVRSWACKASLSVAYATSECVITEVCPVHVVTATLCEADLECSVRAESWQFLEPRVNPFFCRVLMHTEQNMVIDSSVSSHVKSFLHCSRKECCFVFFSGGVGSLAVTVGSSLAAEVDGRFESCTESSLSLSGFPRLLKKENNNFWQLLSMIKCSTNRTTASDRPTCQDSKHV